MSSVWTSSGWSSRGPVKWEKPPAMGTASEPENRLGRARFLFGPRAPELLLLAWLLWVATGGAGLGGEGIRLAGELLPSESRGDRRGNLEWELVGGDGPLSLTSARPLIFRPSATLSKDDRFSWSTDTSPRYMNSKRAFISAYRTSRRNTMGCRSGVLYNMDWK